ncbi:MAG: hypothetical protein QNI91_14125 [Arenicellales bacterium]|nr:hypothetical protein [Arenicellales bacterium]
MKDTSKFRYANHKLFVSVLVIGLPLAAGCGGGSSSGAGIADNDTNIFDPTCGTSDPDFPFCGRNLVGCRNQNQTLYDLFEDACPPGWTVVPEGVAWPELACRNPQGRTFQVDADECPPGWTEFEISFSRSR